MKLWIFNSQSLNFADLQLQCAGSLHFNVIFDGIGIFVRKIA